MSNYAWPGVALAVKASESPTDLCELNTETLTPSLCCVKSKASVHKVNNVHLISLNLPFIL